MEDILASIRRIIADDQQANGSRLGGRRVQPASPAPAPVEAAPHPAASDRDDILDLTDFVPGGNDVVRGNEAHDLASASIVASDGDHLDPTPPHAEPPRDAIHEPEVPAHLDVSEHEAAHEAYAIDDESRELSLLDAPMSESVMSAFEALAATVVLENKPMLEGILRDLLRPMLKAWLDDNLPSLVERLVRVEIERVARGGRP